MTHILLKPTPPHHQLLNKAIDAAYRRGDDAEVDALLIAKLALVRREAAADELDLKGAA